MPPKKRGQNVRGRDKIFRHAIQHVHIGIGHNILGNINLQPISSHIIPSENESAFLLELNEQMLSHSSTDFKTFRWEVFELCETKALFNLNHRKIAEKLLLCLMRRDKYAEGYEAFIRLTIAFARDLQEKFLIYFECFHQAVNSGIFNANNQLVVDTKRLQLIFAAQAAWCREMRNYWKLNKHHKIIERIIRLYIKQMHDNKEYIRRLAAEVLASLGRIAHEIIPLILEEACSDVFEDFESYCVSENNNKKKNNKDNNNDDNNNEDIDNDIENEVVELETENTNNTTTTTTTTTEEEEEEDINNKKDFKNKLLLFSKELLQQYQQQHRLASLPVIDGMCFLAAELLRGIRGALSTNFEHFYILLLNVFGLSEFTQFIGNYSINEDNNESEKFGFSEDEAQNFVHSSQWKEKKLLLSLTNEINNNNNNNNKEEEISQECFILRELTQMIGSIVMSNALKVLTEEVSKPISNSSSLINEKEEKEIDYNEYDSRTIVCKRILSTVGASLKFTAPHIFILNSILHAADYTLMREPASLSFLQEIVNSLKEEIVKEQKILLKVSTEEENYLLNNNNNIVEKWNIFMQASGAMLETIIPLCTDSIKLKSLSTNHMLKLQNIFIIICREIIMTCISAETIKFPQEFKSFEIQLREASKLILFAFTQDILQKNYALCLKDERRICEEELEEEEEYNLNENSEVIKRKKNPLVSCHLTKFAFTLLAPILHNACILANSAVDVINNNININIKNNKTNMETQEIMNADSKDKIFAFAMRDITRAVMIIRMMSDQTSKMISNPLYTLLTLNSSINTNNNINNTNGGVSLLNASFVDSVELKKSVQEIIIKFIKTFAETQKKKDENHEIYAAQWADVVTAILPLVITIAKADKKLVLQSSSSSNNNNNNNKLSFAKRFRDALMSVMGTVRNAACGVVNNNNINNEEATPLTQLTAASYSLFAQASALLIQLTSLETKQNSNNNNNNNNENNNNNNDIQVECVNFLKDAVSVLAASFQDGHIKELSDEETGWLLHGMECLLISLLHLFKVDLDSNLDTSKSDKKKKIKNNNNNNNNSNNNTKEKQEQYLITAISRLHTALDEKSQISLVKILLLEALASPAQSLRVVALRLLRLLCHPIINETQRTAGCTLIPTEFFDSLLNAEHFNPLSASGNLDGIQQALAKITFEAAAGNIKNPMQRLILARAMLGLLHTKYADAWPVALKILSDLVRAENTNMQQIHKEENNSFDIKNNNNNNNNNTSFSVKLDPLVWNEVICRYAHAVVFGDMIRRKSSSSSSRLNNNNNNNNNLLLEEEELYQHLPIWYHIHLTDMQRHEKGELVSKDFSNTRYTSSNITLLQIANKEEEILSWNSHYIPSASPANTHGALAAKATDRAILAKTFLSGLSEITHGAPAGDSRTILILELVLELAAVRRGEHSGGIRQLKMLDERLILALNACTNTSNIGNNNNNNNNNASSDIKSITNIKNEKLKSICVGFISDSNTKLQRAAIDQLKKFKVHPFSRYHAQLIPYCDTQQNLFHFLSTFHVETDIPQEDSGEYIATALTIALPKLIAKVSKEKLKDQAILQRRILGLVTHLSKNNSFAVVLEGLVQRLIFERVITTGSMNPEAFLFSKRWEEWVINDNHCVRRLERLIKQILSTTQLLTVLLQAVGRGFASFAGSCLHLALNAYLISCKQILRKPLNNLEIEGNVNNNNNNNNLESEIQKRVGSALSSSTLNSILPRLRRISAAMVASLCEQFPEEVMKTLRKDISENPNYTNISQSIMGRYISVLHENSNGAMPELINPQENSNKNNNSNNSDNTNNKNNNNVAVTPLLRLVRAWVASPVTMPLIGAFGNTVTTMFQQVFAFTNISNSSNSVSVNSSSLSISGRQPLHQTATLSIYEGLRCVTTILAHESEIIHKFGSPGRTTLRKIYIEPHVMKIFASLYKMIMRGVKSSKDRTSNVSRDKKKAPPIMNFSVPMWKEMIATVTMVSEYLVHDTKININEVSDSIESVNVMLSRLLEMCIAFVAHPACAKDRQTCVTAAGVLEGLLPKMKYIELINHYIPLVRLFNMVTSPDARQSLCRSLKIALSRLIVNPTEININSDNVKRNSTIYKSQLEAIGRAVTCLNSFADNNTSLDKYDFELRFHTFRSLQQFFLKNGKYNNNNNNNNNTTSQTKRHKSNSNNLSSIDQEVRHERDYSGELDVTIPIDSNEAPSLCVEGFHAIAINIVFFLRDPESTIRVLAVQVLDAMLRYASRVSLNYSEIILEKVIRRDILPSLRRGVVSRDVHIRFTHMQSFSALAQYYNSSFTSFALLYSPNIEKSFFANVGHIQHRCRLNALALLREHVNQLLPRDVLRVFLPFLLAAVRDFAQGKRDLQNLTEGRAKGYCNAVLITIATLAAALPWEGYHRVLNLLLLNARENASLRLPMLRGVVMVLDHFHFLDDNNNNNVKSENIIEDDEDDDDNEENDDDIMNSNIALKSKFLKYRNTRVMHVMEEDILPQLYEFLGDNSRKNHPLAAELRGNVHTITNVRSEMRKADNAQQNTAILQLPVAIAITKIVKRFPDESFSLHAEHLLDEVILKLRTKNDKHRESARRILSAMLCETGPGKLSFVIRKLKDHLVHGYQLHVLGYTVVTLLYNLYEPHHAISYGKQKNKTTEVNSNNTEIKSQNKKNTLDSNNNNDNEEDEEEENNKEKDEDEEEEELARQLAPASMKFDYSYGISCLTACLNDLMSILLDDYLGEVGEQKEQVELMSTMIEVKRNRALQGFTLLASHCQAERVIETFLQKITWLLTPPSESNKMDAQSLHGSARAAAMLMQELKTKYSTISKNAAADFIFVQKVRLLAVRVARALMTNSTMEVESSFRAVRELLQKHNDVREAKIRAFEVKDGTRRVRGNIHLTIQKAPVLSRKDQMDANYLVAPAPERVDVDFSTHTVLATQQKQKLRAYRGRYGKELQQAAKDFYREDPTTAVVLDTLDEFLLKYLLSVLKQVLGIGKERKYSKAAVRLDLIRAQKKQRKMMENSENNDNDNDDDDILSNEENEDQTMKQSNNNEEEDDDDEEEDEALLDPQELDDDEGDELDQFAAEVQEEEEDDKNKGEKQETKTKEGKEKQQKSKQQQQQQKKRRPMSDLTVTFTRQHQQLLEELVPVVLITLQGEGSDAVVGHALDCMLALVSLRPPLNIVGTLHTSLYETVTSFFERGGAIKQRAMRVAAAIVSHQKFSLSDAQASQLTLLCHAELIERNEFAPMALSLFHAVLSKHAHVIEVYELIGVITELLLHAGARRLIRQRCIAVLARFLTEYRMTPEKFRSHMDLFCRNLDYPEVTGRIAILELITVLSHRLPTPVLRNEAPLLLLPLSATLAAAEHHEARASAANVLKILVKNAGIDVLAPTLSEWMSTSQTKNMRATAMQAWAVMIPAVAEIFNLNEIEDAKQFVACCAWSLSPVLEAATFDQVLASGMKRRYEELSAQAKRKLEMKSWTFVFFALRCIEAMATAAPHMMWESNEAIGIKIIPWLVKRLILHSHPWIQAAALRIMQLYSREGVEQRCGYLREVEWGNVNFVNSKTISNNSNNNKVIINKKKKKRSRSDDDKEEEIQNSIDSSYTNNLLSMPYVAHFIESSDALDTISRGLETLDEISSVLCTLLQYISLSDVPNEKYNAHRAMQQPARSDAVSLALYFTRAMSTVSVALLVSLNNNNNNTLLQVRKIILNHFETLRHQLHALATPVIRHNTVVNVMVRTTSLVQYFGGFLAAIPTPHSEEKENNNKNENENKEKLAEAAVNWIINKAIGLSFIQTTMVPTITIAMRCSDRSEKLSTLASQASIMLREQLERLRTRFNNNNNNINNDNINNDNNMNSGRKEKRARLEKMKESKNKQNKEEIKEKEENNNNNNNANVTLDDVLFELTAEVAEVRGSRKDEITRRETVKTLRKRTRSGSEFTSFKK